MIAKLWLRFGSVLLGRNCVWTEIGLFLGGQSVHHDLLVGRFVEFVLVVDHTLGECVTTVSGNLQTFMNPTSVLF